MANKVIAKIKKGVVFFETQCSVDVAVMLLMGNYRRHLRVNLQLNAQTFRIVRYYLMNG